MSGFFEILISFPIRFPKTVIALTLLVTLGAVYLLGNPGLKLDSTPYPLNQKHPSMVAFNKLKEDFSGTMETGLVHFRHPDTIYNAESLRRISTVTRAFENITIIGPADVERLKSFLAAVPEDQATLIKGILEGGITREDSQQLLELTDALDLAGQSKSPLGAFLDEITVKLYPIKKVTSLANVEYLESRGDELVVGKVFESVPATPAEWALLRKRVEDNDLIRGMLVSEDGKSTIIQAEVQIHYTRSDLVYEVGQALSEVLRTNPGKARAHLAGFPIMTSTFQKAIQDDNQKFFPVVVLLVLIALFATFRTFGGVVLPMGVVIISIIWTMAIMVLLDVPLNMMTTTLPVFLIAIGVADGVHILSEFQDQFRATGDRIKAVRLTMEHMFLPVLMTSVTTGVGFISLAITDVTMIQKFGIFVSVGVFAAMVFSLAFLPAILTFGRQSPRLSGAGRRLEWVATLDQKMLQFLRSVSAFSIRQNRIILAVSVVLLLGAAFGLSRLRVENDFLTYFPDDKDIVVAAKSLDTHMAGNNVVNLLIRGAKGDSEPFKKPENLLALEKMQDFVEKQAIVGKTISLADMVKRIHRVMNGDRPEMERIPLAQEILTRDGKKEVVDGRNLIAQYLLLYENGGGENLYNNVDSTFTNSNMVITLKSQNSVVITKLMQSARDFAEANFPSGLTIAFAGGAELGVSTNNEIVRTQVTSLIISMVVVFFLLLFQFRSLEKATLAIIPLLATVVLNFGVMGWLGITLNVAIAIVSSIVIGIGVDFAIHYLSRLQTEIRRNDTMDEAFGETMMASGKAITANAMVVAIGFLALIMSVLGPLQTMGLLIAQTLVLSMVTTLVLVPAVASFFRPKFLMGGAAVQRQPENLAMEGDISG